MKLEFSRQVSKNIQIPNFMKIRLVGGEYHADRRTDWHDEANSRFSQFYGRTPKQNLDVTVPTDQLNVTGLLSKTKTLTLWIKPTDALDSNFIGITTRGELSYLAPIGSENISAPYFKQCFFRGGGSITPRQSNTTPPSPKTEITNILFYILNFASIIKFKM